MCSCSKNDEKDELSTNNSSNQNPKVTWIEAEFQTIIQKKDWVQNGNQYNYTFAFPISNDQLPDSIGTAYGNNYQGFRIDFPGDLYNIYSVNYQLTDSSWVVSLKPYTSGVALDEQYSYLKFTGVYYYKH